MSTKTATINARIEPELKSKAEKILHRVGLSSAEAIRIFYHQVCLQKGLPLDVKLPNRKTAKAIQELESGRGQRFKSVQDMKDDVGRA